MVFMRMKTFCWWLHCVLWFYKEVSNCSKIAICIWVSIVMQNNGLQEKGVGVTAGSRSEAQQVRLCYGPSPPSSVIFHPSPQIWDVVFGQLTKEGTLSCVNNAFTPATYPPMTHWHTLSLKQSPPSAPSYIHTHSLCLSSSGKQPDKSL